MEKKPRLKIYNPIIMNGLLIAICVIVIIFCILLAIYFPMFAVFTLIIIVGFLIYVFYNVAHDKASDVDQQDTTDTTDQVEDTSADTNQVEQDTKTKTSQKYKKIINGMDATMLIVYIMLWVIYILLAIYFQTWINPSMVTIFINLIVICGLLLIIFYNPMKKNFDSDIESAQKGYSKYVQQELVTGSHIFSDHMKTTFTTALNKKNEYFVLAFMLFLYLPFLYYLAHLINNQHPTIADAIVLHASTAFTRVSLGLLIFVIVWFFIYGFNIWILILGLILSLFFGFQLYNRMKLENKLHMNMFYILNPIYTLFLKMYKPKN